MNYFGLFYDTLHDVIVETLGPYTPLEGEGLAAVDFSYIVAGAVFILGIWAVLRIIINLISGRR